ncbi:hypothetical protein Hrd1104_01455 [Halorhabdus sp. CBA1104]|uniref:hypothetical protein n=1 Tax=unclassified Halorhabdus TaxID=2621901 RepID=UPI0012B1BF79|nr:MULTISPECIES: hypothetical protein [unclassified Halorhabdus]QGN06089.1 hypothetical protein Hrd1104_01455 [Halorhabdus sp. CBA1104]
MCPQTGDYDDRAVAALADRNYETAGDAFARAGWQTLTAPRPGQSPFDADEKGWVGNALKHHVTSALCYRVAGCHTRARHRGTEAAAIGRDLQTVLEHPAQQACLQELIGDARLAGGLDGPAEAYSEAAQAYRGAAKSVEEPQYWGTTPLFEAATAPLQQVARSTANGEIAVTWEALHGSDPSRPGQFLAHRATFKRQRFPALLESVLADGYLAAPRGTTEYNNANYQCPACGSTDVNWVAESVLCLRCSTPAERQ